MKKEEYMFRDELMKLGVHRDVECQMVDDDFRSITDFNGLTAERLVAQYPALKFGTAHRLCAKASIPRLVAPPDGIFGVPKMIADTSSALYGHILAGQDTPKMDTRVKFDFAKHSDQLVKLMIDYYGSRTSLRNMALDIGIQPDRRPESTEEAIAEDIVAECHENRKMTDLFCQLATDFNGDPEMTQFLSQFLPEVTP